MNTNYCSNTYYTTIQQDYDVLDGYYYYINIPDQILCELAWNDNTKLDLSIKLGPKGNVLVISKA